MKYMTGIRNITGRSLALSTFILLATAHLTRADIVGGEEVRQCDPIEDSVVALYRQTPQGGALCTATLLSREIALTAAHCVEHGIDRMRVIFGRNLKAKDARRAEVTDAIVSDQWGRTSDRDQGDIALVRFEGGLPQGYHPARLLPKSRRLTEGEEVILAGYGIADASSRQGAGRLRKTRVQVSDPAFGRSEILLDQSHGHGACHGDSGGPAFVESEGKYYVVGVTNRAYPSTAPDDCAHQVVYARIDAYREWIQEGKKRLHEAN